MKIGKIYLITEMSKISMAYLLLAIHRASIVQKRFAYSFLNLSFQSSSLNALISIHQETAAESLQSGFHYEVA